MSHLIHDFEIFEAARNNDAKRVRELLDAGVDINVQDFDRRQTPLHLACAHGAKAVVELLVKRGADLGVRDCNELTPLHHLVMNKFDVLAIWLVHNGADIHQKDRKLFSPLDYGLPSTQRELRIAAGELQSDKDQKQEIKAPQLYRSPTFHVDKTLMNSRRMEVRVRLENGSYKTLRIGPDVTCGALIQMAAEKFNIPAQYASSAILFECKQGVERSVGPSVNAFELRSHWPHIITTNGNETLEQCYFILRCSAGAPANVKEFYAKLQPPSQA